MTSEALHYWILVLDMESFSTRSDPIQRSLRDAMYEVVESAFAQAGIDRGKVVTEDRGDGILILVPPTISPVRLAGPLIRALDDGLREKAQVFSAAHSLRMRLALHQGLAVRDRHGWSGDAVNTACRLVDAQPLRDALRAADSAHLAFIVSDQVYDGVVRHAHRGIDPAAYLPLRFTTKHGEVMKSWITVPGFSAPPGLPPQPKPAPPPPSAIPGVAQADGGKGAEAGNGAIGGSDIQVGVVHGDVIGRDKVVHQQGPARW
jgi:class 3 adenylate cyclase